MPGSVSGAPKEVRQFAQASAMSIKLIAYQNHGLGPGYVMDVQGFASKPQTGFFTLPARRFLRRAGINGLCLHMAPMGWTCEHSDTSRRSSIPGLNWHFVPDKPTLEERVY
jgi:hypothetical protein